MLVLLSKKIKQKTQWLSNYTKGSTYKQKKTFNTNTIMHQIHHKVCIYNSMSMRYDLVMHYLTFVLFVTTIWHHFLLRDPSLESDSLLRGTSGPVSMSCIGFLCHSLNKTLFFFLFKYKLSSDQPFTEPL